jgi:peptidoglycan/xylan/chitin deacetylase (PgdA/CDA1 family)
MSEYVQDWYQWNLRPQNIERPAWFRSWPGDARIAVSLKLMHEWESIPRPVSRGGTGAATANTRDYWSLGVREYGFKSAAPRLMDVLDRHGVKATIMTSGLAAELWPDSVRDFKRRGHEIASHSWDQSFHLHTYKTREEERDALRKSLDAIEKATGERPTGYMSQGPRPTPNTLELIADEGIVWTADYHDCDVPYVINVNGRKIVSVGYAKPAFTDNDIIPLGQAAGLRQLKDEFDATYEEAARHPMRFGYALHVHLSGTPGLARMLDRFLAHIKSRDCVWFCRCGDMAKFWLDHAG